MATSPITPLPMSLAAMVLAYKRNRVAEYQARDHEAQAFCDRADALEKSICQRVDELLACEGVTLGDLAGAGL